VKNKRISEHRGRPLNILIIGAGMYTCGRGTDGYGTIMPAICEWNKTSAVGEVYVAGRSLSGVRAAKNKIEELQRILESDIPVTYFPEGGDDPKCYLKALRGIAGPACAIVAIPDNLHKEAAGAAIEEGLHVLVVKPLVPTIKEALELIKLQDRRQVYCAVEFHKRFDYANLKLKEAIEAGLIGDPLYFIAEFSQRKSIPTKIFKKWVKSTNIFQYLGIHYVDIVYFATGATPVRVMAVGQKNWLSSKGIDTYDSVESVIEWEMPSGKRFSSHILTNWIDPETTSAMSDQKIKVIGTKGRFESDQKNRGIKIVTDSRGVEEPNPYFCSRYDLQGKVAYRGYGIESICRFLDDAVRIEEGTVKIADLEKTRPTFKRSIVPTAVLEGINRSLDRGGNWVNIRRIKI
jgi:D-galacturonate reductase